MPYIYFLIFSVKFSRAVVSKLRYVYPKLSAKHFKSVHKSQTKSFLVSKILLYVFYFRNLLYVSRILLYVFYIRNLLYVSRNLLYVFYCCTVLCSMNCTVCFLYVLLVVIYILFYMQGE